MSQQYANLILSGTGQGFNDKIAWSQTPPIQTLPLITECPCTQTVFGGGSSQALPQQIMQGVLGAFQKIVQQLATIMPQLTLAQPTAQQSTTPQTLASGSASGTNQTSCDNGLLGGIFGNKTDSAWLGKATDLVGDVLGGVASIFTKGTSWGSLFSKVGNWIGKLF